MRISRYSNITARYQPWLLYASKAGRNRLTWRMRVARWFHLVFGQLPCGFDRVEPGFSPEAIGTGYHPPYYPPNKKGTA